MFPDAFRILTEAQDEFKPVKTYVMFSGGNDSTVLLHWAWQTGLVDAACHVNTGIGIEKTRTFVRDFCQDYKIPLIEKHPPNLNYEDLVMKYGFPGPSMHRTMYQQLKERAIRELVRESKTKRSDRVMLVTGIRRQESQRRMGHVDIQRFGAQVWVSPMIDATKSDLVKYRIANEVPENEVSATLHMSGECLCGAYAHPGELEEIRFWYPETAEYIDDLERRVEASGQVRCKWGAGGKAPVSLKPTGPLCTTCDSLFDQKEPVSSS